MWWEWIVVQWFDNIKVYYTLYFTAPLRPGIHRLWYWTVTVTVMALMMALFVTTWVMYYTVLYSTISYCAVLYCTARCDRQLLLYGSYSTIQYAKWLHKTFWLYRVQGIYCTVLVIRTPDTGQCSTVLSSTALHAAWRVEVCHVLFQLWHKSISTDMIGDRSQTSRI